MRTLGDTHINRHNALTPDVIDATRKVTLVLKIPTISATPHNADPSCLRCKQIDQSPQMV